MVTPKNDVNVTQTRPVNIIQLEAAVAAEEKKPGLNSREFTVNSVASCHRSTHFITVFPLLYSLQSFKAFLNVKANGLSLLIKVRLKRKQPSCFQLAIKGIPNN